MQFYFELSFRRCLRLHKGADGDFLGLFLIILKSMWCSNRELLLVLEEGKFCDDPRVVCI